MKWTINRVTKSQRRIAKRLHDSVDQAVAGIKRRYILWCRKNRFASVPTYATFVLCAASMNSSQLKPNSIKTYLTNILRAFRWDMQRDTYSRCKHALGKWEYASRHHPTRRALEIPIQEARSIAKSLKNPTARLAAELMCYTPLRLGDIGDVRWREIEVTSDFVIFHLVGGKNRRTQITQERHRVPKGDLPQWLLRCLCEGSHRRPPEEHVVSMTVPKLNRLLQETSGRPVTTYSLRHAFHKEVIRLCTSEGRVDWEEVARRTLHRSAKTVKAHYDRPGAG